MRRDAPVAVPQTVVRADRRQLERWENEGGGLGTAGVRPSAAPGGEAG